VSQNYCSCQNGYGGSECEINYRKVNVTAITMGFACTFLLTGDGYVYAFGDNTVK
jgi:hypothetical protein